MYDDMIWWGYGRRRWRAAVLSRNSSGKPRKTTKTLTQVSRSSGRHSGRPLPEYKPWTLLLDRPGRQYSKNRGLLEEFYLLWSAERQPTFRRNISPPSSGPKNKPSKKPDIRALLANLFHAGFLLGLFLCPEDGGDMFLRKVGSLSMDYMELYPTR
jgi:hypothetical protein